MKSISNRLVLRRNLTRGTRFAPTVQVDGQTVTPTNWQWLLGFALGGCDWAKEAVLKPAFMDQVQRDVSTQSREVQARTWEFVADKLAILRKQS